MGEKTPIGATFWNGLSVFGDEIHYCLICATFWNGMCVPLEREKIKSRIEILSPGGDRSCSGSDSFRLRSPSILIKERMVMMVMMVIMVMVMVMVMEIMR